MTQYATTLDEVLALRSENAKLRGALGPFAEALTRAEAGEYGEMLESCRAHVTLYEFANARSALESAAMQPVPGSRVTEEACPGHVASENDPKVCGRCGVHINSLRPPEEDLAAP